MEWKNDKEIEKKLHKIIQEVPFSQIDPKSITLFRSFGSTSRAWARIWGLPRVWQQALNIKPHYIIEVISERFDKLSPADQTKTLIHELMHIPKKFSGGLVPHRGRQHYNIDRRVVDSIYEKYIHHKTVITSDRRERGNLVVKLKRLPRRSFHSLLAMTRGGGKK